VTGFSFKSTHVLPIERPERYVKQLNSHLANKAELYEGFLLFQDLGAGEAEPLDNKIQLTAYSDSEEGLNKIQNILAKHLYKFAKVTDQDPIWNLEKKNVNNN